MRNTLLVCALFTAVLIITFITDYAYTNQVYESRANEIALYEELNADPHTLYNGYTVEQLGEYYQKPESSFGKVSIDMPVINQFPELPVGCEIAAAASVLNYLGFDIDKVTMAEEYFVYDDSFTYDENGDSRGPDPYKVFAGDPFSWGYGCFAPVVKDAMNKYFKTLDSGYRAYDLYEMNSADIEKLIDEGVPIIVWATQDMKPFNYRSPAEWYINGTNEKYQWLGNSHTLVLCGYDNACYYFMDCNDKTEIIPYVKGTFLKRFEEAGKQCVVVKK